MSERIVLAGAVRTPIGKFCGSLADIPVEKLGALVIREALNRAGVEGARVDEVLMGCILQACRGQNVARQAAVSAGIPVEVPALTLNNVCGSGLKAVNLAADMIRSGSAEVVVAGGMENMSAAPYALEKARTGFRMGDSPCVDTMVCDALTDVFHNYHMGITAENVAEQYGITREMQDEFAAASQRKCEAAWNEGRFDGEIVPVPVKVKKETVPFSRDEHFRPGVTVQDLAALKPAFKKDGGTVTAGNASGINDGAAAVVVMSERKARELGVTPMAVFAGGTSAGVDPSVMGIGPAFSTRRLLERTGMNIGDFDLIEANEAFAAQALAVGTLLGWDWDRVNVNGGAIALGHPVGASGCRILVTLLHEMERRGANKGLATLCVGGGMGVSAAFERWDG
jgi:acetyl-CoA C-acetyltransferase